MSTACQQYHFTYSLEVTVHKHRLPPLQSKSVYYDITQSQIKHGEDHKTNLSNNLFQSKHKQYKTIKFGKVKDMTNNNSEIKSMSSNKEEIDKEFNMGCVTRKGT